MGVSSIYVAPSWLEAPPMRRTSPRRAVYECIRQAGVEGVGAEEIAKATHLAAAKTRACVASLRSYRRPCVLAVHTNSRVMDLRFTADRILQHLRVGELLKASNTLAEMLSRRNQDLNFEKDVAEEIAHLLGQDPFRIWMTGLSEKQMLFVSETSAEFLHGLFSRGQIPARIFKLNFRGFDVDVDGQVVDLAAVRRQKMLSLLHGSNEERLQAMAMILRIVRPQPAYQ